MVSGWTGWGLPWVKKSEPTPAVCTWATPKARGWTESPGLLGWAVPLGWKLKKSANWRLVMGWLVLFVMW